MLSGEEAWAIVNELPPCKFNLENTDGDVVAPVTTSLSSHAYKRDRWNCPNGRETLMLWHAIASCPGYGAAENPSFWMRTLRSMCGTWMLQPIFDRARFFPDPRQHPFPSVTLLVNVEHTQRPGLPSDHGNMTSRYLTQFVDVDAQPRSDALCTALERLGDHIDPVRFSRPIPVRLVYHVGHWRYISGPAYDHYTSTWAVSSFIRLIHEWLVQLPEKCTPMWIDDSSEAALASRVPPRPRFVVESVSFPDIYDIRVEMDRELQSLMDDPRLEHIAFPEIELVKIHQSTQRKTVHRFLNYFLRPLHAAMHLESSPRLPQSLTLRLTNDGTDDAVGAHVELFFQLLPFTQCIRSLTLLGMDHSRQWGWLGFALFHPRTQSSLRKLKISTPNYELSPVTLALYVQALRLRTASVDQFKAVIDGGTSRRIECVRWEDLDVSAVPLTQIEHVTIDVSMQATDPEWWHHDKRIYDLSQWAIFLKSLAPSVRQIHVTPLHQFKIGAYSAATLASMPSVDVVRLVRGCPLLKELSIPVRGWTTKELVEFFSFTSLQSIELHAEVQEIRETLQVLRGLDPHSRRHLQRLGIGVLFDAFIPIEWFLFDEMLDTSRSLEYVYVHMGNLNQSGFRHLFGQHPPGELARRVKSRNSELLLSPQVYQDQKVAFLGVLHHREQALGNKASSRLDAALVSIIFRFMRPFERRFVGIDWVDWANGGRIITIEDPYATADLLSPAPVYRLHAR